MPPLSLRTIGIKDYAVLDDGHRFGRIRYAAERTNEIWMWNVTIPEPGGGHGTSPTFEEANTAFKESWTKFKAEIGPERLASALELAEAARERLKAKK
jgi:hypothetical protein